MKATFRLGIKSLSGTARDDGIVFMAFRGGLITVVRSFAYPRFTDHNAQQGAKMRAAARLWNLVEVDFRNALQDYADSYNTERRPRNRLLIHGYNIWTRALMRHLAPLTNIPMVESILGSTVNEWIDAGFLAPVTRRPDSFDITLT